MISKEAIYFLAETKQEDIKLSWEHKSYKWADFEEALTLLKFKNSKELLKKAHKLVNKKNLKDFFN